MAIAMIDQLAFLLLAYDTCLYGDMHHDTIVALSFSFLSPLV